MQKAMCKLLQGPSISTYSTQSILLEPGWHCFSHGQPLKFQYQYVSRCFNAWLGAEASIMWHQMASCRFILTWQVDPVQGPQVAVFKDKSMLLGKSGQHWRLTGLKRSNSCRGVLNLFHLFLSRSGATIMELPGAPKNTYAFMWLGAQAITDIN